MAVSSEGVRATATRVRHEAEVVRQVAVRVGATRGVSWRSVTATRFREVVSAEVGGLGRAAGLLDSAGEALEAHAAALERAEEVLRAATAGLTGTGGPR